MYDITESERTKITSAVRAALEEFKHYLSLNRKVVINVNIQINTAHGGGAVVRENILNVRK